MTYEEIEKKLIRLMLDVSAHSGEVDTSASKLAYMLRKRGVTADMMLNGVSTPNTQQTNQASPFGRAQWEAKAKAEKARRDAERQAQEQREAEEAFYRAERQREAERAERERQEKLERERREKAAQAQPRPQPKPRAKAGAFKGKSYKTVSENPFENPSDPNWTFSFGQYRGLKIEQVFHKDNQYLLWILDEMSVSRPKLCEAIKAFYKKY